MQYRKLGRTGLTVSCIGFGALPFAGLNQEEAGEVLNAALDAGVNFVDTARGYRESEKLIGKTVSDRREDFFLATKSKARTEKRIMEELKISLSNLHTDVIDLYQVHYVNSREEYTDVMKKGGALDVFKKIRERGTARYIGITGHNVELLHAAARTGEFDTVQAAFSYIERGQEVFDLIEYCAGHDIGFIVQKPLAGGALTLAGPALRWILQFPVSTVVPGMVSVEQVEENTALAEAGYTLSDEEQNGLDELVSGLDRYFCRRCYYCHAACPEKIRIGVILEFYGKAQFPENLTLYRNWYRGYQINAANCTECGLCEPECPYGLPIRQMLRNAHELLAR
jgi:predicted aldo/keto reductase-like oxidoreductase